MKPLLVLGIGNILLRDEGAGVRAIEALRLESLPGEVELLDGGTGGANLVEAVAGRRKVIVIDAVRYDAPPGTVIRFTGDELAAFCAGALSLHDLGLMDALHMARLTGCAPAEVVIFGIVPKEVRFGLEITEEVRGAIPQVIEYVRTELASNAAPARETSASA